jgi:hypothetical protein
MPDYRVIIAGSRSFNDYTLLREHCLSVLQEKMKTHRVIIVSGHARGADSLGERFANELGLPFELHPAKWRLLGKAAGMVRNAEMAKCSDALIAFWDGESRGTRHMINFARKRGLDISVFNTSQTRSQTIIDNPFKENNGKLLIQDSKCPGSHFHR